MFRERVVQAVAAFLGVPVRFGDGASNWNKQSVLLRPIANALIVSEPCFTLGEEKILGIVRLPGLPAGSLPTPQEIMCALEREPPGPRSGPTQTTSELLGCAAPTMTMSALNG